MNKIDSIIDYIKTNWSKYDIVNAWNTRCESGAEYDSYIEGMDSFDELMDGKSPMDIAMTVTMGSFNCNDDYFCFDGYGNIKTFSYPDDSDSPFDYYEMAEYLAENGDVDTAEIDTDFLLESFIQYLEDNDVKDNDLNEIVSDLIDEECFDLLTDEWPILMDSVKHKIDEITIPLF